MILPRPVYESICQRHGLDPDAAHGWIVKSSAVFVEIDDQAGDVPWKIASATAPSRPAPAAARGPGTELKKLLARLGIVASPGCSCNSMAARMDAAGPDGSESMLADVLAVMQAEAKKRGLPWIEAAARLLVKKAIRNARKAS